MKDGAVRLVNGAVVRRDAMRNEDANADCERRSVSAALRSSIAAFECSED
jgi:hypothetical protein